MTSKLPKIIKFNVNDKDALISMPWDVCIMYSQIILFEIVSLKYVHI